MAKSAKTKKERSGLSREVIESQALKNATENDSEANYETIFEGFLEKGIEFEDIIPRENVFTYNAWRAMGRQVRRGETGVKCVTYVTAKPSKAKADAGKVDEEGKPFKFERTVSVFHISQTDEISPSVK